MSDVKGTVLTVLLRRAGRTFELSLNLASDAELPEAFAQAAKKFERVISELRDGENRGANS